jgi:hypothetical protein
MRATLFHRVGERSSAQCVAQRPSSPGPFQSCPAVPIFQFSLCNVLPADVAACFPNSFLVLSNAPGAPTALVAVALPARRQR